MRVGETGNNSTIDLALGETLEICLPETPTTGYRWQVIAAGSPVCAIASDAFTTPSSPVPGGAGEHCWNVTAVRAGECDIELQQRRRWEAAGEPARLFTLHVRVGRSHG